MSDIFASFAAGTPRSAASGAGETAVRVVDPSPDLSRLVGGESLRGTVVGKDAQGHLLVRTRLGVLQLAAHRPLPAGTEVVLQVRSVGPQVLLNLLPLEAARPHAGAATGQPAPGPTTPGPTTPGLTAPGAAAGTTPTPALPPNPLDLVQRGRVIRGVLHAAPPVPLLAGLPTAQPGAELLVRVLSLGVHTPQARTPATGSPAPGRAGTPPAGGTGPVPPGAPGTPSQAIAPATGGGVAGGRPGNGPPATPGVTPAPAGDGRTGTPAPGLRLAPQTPVANSGHSLATVLQSVSAEAAARAAGTPPSVAPTVPGGAATGTPGPTPEAAAKGLRLTALVTGATSSGQPILHTAFGTLTLDTRAALPQGSSLALQVTLPAVTESPAAQALAAVWPSLDSLQETLFQGLPAQQMEAAARSLPQVGPRLASGVLFFLSALNQGNPLGWLGHAVAPAEQSGQTEFFERLGREFIGLNRSIETAAGEWRFVNLPLWSDQGLRELRCYFRHQDQGGGKGGDGDKATRFVLELDLKRHGELQLDGLVRARRFDLVLRSRRPLPALVRGDLMALFEEANAIAGYSGQLVFRASKDWLQLLSARSDNHGPREGLTI